MADATPENELHDLIPDVRAWNNGRGISPSAWISHKGNYELAVGYSLIFWPRFVLIEDHVLRDGATLDNLALWKEATKGDNRAAEAVINHVHIADIHMGAAEPTEAQLRYIGRILVETHRAKLGLDFPDRKFEVRFPDEPDLDYLEYELTFWQVRD